MSSTVLLCWFESKGYLGTKQNEYLTWKMRWRATNLMLPYESNQYCLTTLRTSAPSKPAGLMIARPVSISLWSKDDIHELVQRSNDTSDGVLARKLRGNLLHNRVGPIDVSLIGMPSRERLELAGVIESILAARCTMKVNDELQAVALCPRDSLAKIRKLTWSPKSKPNVRTRRNKSP